jgi:hypothetical protein
VLPLFSRLHFNLLRVYTDKEGKRKAEVATFSIYNSLPGVLSRVLRKSNGVRALSKNTWFFVLTAVILKERAALHDIRLQIA